MPGLPAFPLDIPSTPINVSSKKMGTNLVMSGQRTPLDVLRRSAFQAQHHFTADLGWIARGMVLVHGVLGACSGFQGPYLDASWRGTGNIDADAGCMRTRWKGGDGQIMSKLSR